MLVAIHPHGSMDVDIPYAALGSGGLAAMGVLESQYRSTTVTTIEKGIEIVIHAVKAGIQNDLGSGSSIDVCIIQPPNDGKDPHGVVYIRHMVEEDSIPMSKMDNDIIKKVEERFLDSEKDPGSIKEKLLLRPLGSGGGFGSVPYWIQRKSMVLMSEDLIHKTKDRWLQDVLCTTSEMMNETMVNNTIRI
jgi:20S proteasome subunit beta 2